MSTTPLGRRVGDDPKRASVAVVGSGVSGLVTAALLHPWNDVTVFESDGRIGGHVNTVEVDDGRGGTLAIDTGFIVYNEHNYPLLTRLFDRLGVATQPSNMSFSVRADRTGLEYGTATLRSLFTQPRNVLSPRFHGMLLDILRFNRRAVHAVGNGAARLSLGEYVEAAGYSPWLSEHYLVPMGSALWSIPRASVMEMPAELFVRFFEQHGMLTPTDLPQWRVVLGGSTRYVEALVAPFRDRIRAGARVRRVARRTDHVLVDGERFDHVVMACHADQALALMTDPSLAEREILGAIPFQTNEVVLHTDTSVLPRSRTAWASWNYHVKRDEAAPAVVTYNMNSLQTLEAADTYCVTLNATEDIEPAHVLYRTSYEHPVFTLAGLAAQKRRAEISGVRRTHYCGAYWGFGFHEDGVRSAYDVARAFGVEP